ncbi:MAG: hypothetical protein AB8H79_18160 [Myxococcota bacterium]
MSRHPSSQPIQTRWLTDDEINVFHAQYAHFSGLRPGSRGGPAGRARGFWRGPKMLGGYRVGHDAQRYAILAGPNAVANWPFQPVDAAEITHLWISDALKSDERRGVYGWILTDLMATGKRIFVGGSVDASIAQQQSRSLPFPLGAVRTDALGPRSSVAFYWGTLATLIADAIKAGVPLPWLGLAR